MKPHSRGLRVEPLEPRLALSAPPAVLEPDSAADVRSVTGPAISLRVVISHELGHALGLDHTTDPSSIMYPYYNPLYDFNTFATDPAVFDVQQLYSQPNAGPWKDELDLFPGNGKVDITYSFVPDGTVLEKGRPSELFAAFRRLFGGDDSWTNVFLEEMARWSRASGGRVRFLPFDGEAGRERERRPLNFPGLAQSNPAVGDIRFSAQNLDGPAAVLARTYFPPPNGGTRAGDMLLDASENWEGRAAPPSPADPGPVFPAGALVLPALALVDQPSLLGPGQEAGGPTPSGPRGPSAAVLGLDDSREFVSSEHRTVRFQSDDNEQMAAADQAAAEPEEPDLFLFFLLGG